MVRTEELGGGVKPPTPPSIRTLPLPYGVWTVFIHSISLCVLIIVSYYVDEQVYNSKRSTASGNWLSHGAEKHDMIETNLKSTTMTNKITNWIGIVKTNKPASSQFVFNRDLALWCCEDLLPFGIVEKSGFKTFSRNLNYDLPSRKTLSVTALRDIYLHLKERIRCELAEARSITLMMDGWTDRLH